MSSILKKISADKMAFTHHPKSFKIETSLVAKDFVHLQEEQSSDFQIADVVAAQSGIEALRKKNIESQVEGTVLDRLKEIEEKAYAQAYELGMAEGREQAFLEKQSEFLDRLEKIDKFLLGLEHRKTNALKDNEATLMKIIFQIAEKIALREVTISNEPIVELLTKLISEVQGAENVTVKMNPQDYSFVEMLRQKNVKAIEKLDRVKLQAVESIQMGGCIIETNFGEIDATLAERVEKAWVTIKSKLPFIKIEGPT